MPEYIEREAALKIIDNYGKTVTADAVVVVEAIKVIVGVITPAADVVEVVRCKDCKHRYELLCCYGEYDYGFCNYGERNAILTTAKDAAL